MAAVKVMVFSDFTCPFSYVTEEALRRIGEEMPLEVRALPFELYPAPEPLPPAPDTGWEDVLRPLAAEVGITLRPPASAMRTRKAHEAARFAAQRDAGPAMRGAIFRAVFAEGRDVGRIDVLSALAGEVGLDPTETRVVLDVDTFAAEVAREEEAARRAGVTATPTLVIGEGAEARVLAGAMPLAELRAALRGG